MKLRALKTCLLFFTILIVFLSCKKDEEVKEDEKNEITIGVLLPLTGAAASTGESTESAIQIALEDVNQYLTEIGSKKSVKIIIEDTQTDTVVALQKLMSLKNKGVQLVIGPYSSASVKAVKDYADQNNILVVSPSSVATSLAIPDDNIYRLVPSDNSQGQAITALLNDDSIEMIIPIVRDDLWGNELLATVSQQYTNSKNSVFAAVKYSTTTTDFISQIYQLKLNLMDALNQHPAGKIGIYMVSFGEGTDILAEATNEASLSQVKWYGSSAYAENSSLLQNTNAAAFAYGRGLPCPIFGYDDAAVDKWQPLIEKIEAEIGRKPEIYALVSYDALWLGTMAYLSTGVSVSTDKLINAFVHEANNYFGVTGRTSLNPAGDRAYAIYEFWGINFNSVDYNWSLFAKYNNATGELTRY